jgi:hypothetical protein
MGRNSKVPNNLRSGGSDHTGDSGQNSLEQDFSIGEKSPRQGSGDCATERSEDWRLATDSEARRLIEYIRSTRPEPCKKSMAARARLILEQLGEVI